MSAQPSELCELNHQGDTKTLWDPNNPEEVEIARTAFKNYIDRGFSVFRVESDGGKGERMTSFDPKAAKLIAVPRIVSG